MVSSNFFSSVDRLGDCLILDRWLNLCYSELHGIFYWRVPARSLLVLVIGLVGVSFPSLSLIGALLFGAVYSGPVLSHLGRVVLEKSTVSIYQHVKHTATIGHVSNVVRQIQYWVPKEARKLNVGFYPGYFHYSAAFAVAAVLLFGPGDVLCTAMIVAMALKAPINGPFGEILAALSAMIDIGVSVGEHVGSDRAVGGVDRFEWVSGGTLEWSVQLYENQRWWAGVGWCSDMLRDDPLPWSNARGSLGLRRPDMYQDVANWSTGDWLYGATFADAASGAAFAGCHVRRRTWRGSIGINLNEQPLGPLADRLRMTALASCV